MRYNDLLNSIIARELNENGRKMSLANKVIIVTGASSGIGASIALQVVEEGASVVIIGRNEDKLKTTKKNCDDIKPNKTLLIKADITNDDEAEKIIQKTVEKFGKIDALVNNAGFAIEGKITDNDAIKSFDSVHSTNLRAVVVLTHFAMPHIIKTKGSIVNISSGGAIRPLSHIWSYSTAKAGVDHFTRNIAKEYGPLGVRVNVVSPGPVETDFFDNMGINEEDVKAKLAFYAKLSSLGRVSKPREVSEMVVFLISDKAVGVTGSTFCVDNGCLL